jgi:hypothetical protein
VEITSAVLRLYQPTSRRHQGRRASAIASSRCASCSKAKIARLTLPDQPPPPGPSGLRDGFEPLGEALEGSDGAVGSLALMGELRCGRANHFGAFGHFGVGPLALAGEEGFEPIDVGLQRCDVAFETGDKSLVFWANHTHVRPSVTRAVRTASLQLGEDIVRTAHARFAVVALHARPSSAHCSASRAFCAGSESDAEFGVSEPSSVHAQHPSNARARPWCGMVDERLRAARQDVGAGVCCAVSSSHYELAP